MVNLQLGGFLGFFRWFKFTLKPPYSITTANYDWPFGTLPFELFGSNLDTRDLDTYPRTYSGHFEICQFLTIPGPFEYLSENGWSQKIKVFSMKERSLPPLSV